MKILITGNAGFIGSYLVKALEGKCEKLGIDKKYGLNICDNRKIIDLLESSHFKPDIIVHLAAQTSRKSSEDQPDVTFWDNVMGTHSVCELAKQTGAKVIFASTRYVKKNPEGKRDFYGFSKYIGEKYMNHYHKNHALDFITDRIGNVYGVGQQGSPEAFWVAWFIEASLTNKPIQIYGFNGNQSRDMLYVTDLIDLLVDQIFNFDKYANRLYEVGGGEENEVSLRQALKFLRYDNFSIVAGLPGDTKRLVFKNGQVNSINGWKPVVGWQEGFKRVLEDYRSRIK
jgi:nucleoside-diphosphate-sugar epimerase